MYACNITRHELIDSGKSIRLTDTKGMLIELNETKGKIIELNETKEKFSLLKKKTDIN